MKKSVNGISTAILTILLISGSSSTLQAGAPNPNNVIASVNEFTGSTSAPKYVAEYTPAGALVGATFAVPQLGPSPPDQARGLVMGPDSAIYLYNGTFDPWLSRLETSSNGWTHQNFAGWSTVNNISYGGLDRFGNYLFATDMETFGAGDLPQGVVRFDTSGGPTVRFATTIEPIDLHFGPDGVLYALDGSVHKYDPITFASLGTVPLGFADNRALSIATDGSIVVATWGGQVNRYSPTGMLIDTLTVPGATFSDVDINPDNKIVLGTGFDGEIIFTDLELDVFDRHRVTASTSGGDTFVSWVVSIPEPTSILILGLGIALIRCRRPSNFH